LGFAIGAGVSLAIDLGRQIFGESPQEKFEKATDDFLQGALEADGLDPEMAKRLRDVGGAAGDFAGVGRTIQELAESHGLTGRDILEKMEGMSDGQREDVVKMLLELPTNAGAIDEARAEGKDPPAFEITGDADFGFGNTLSPEQILQAIGFDVA
jgi:hypothetical protein